MSFSAPMKQTQTFLPDSKAQSQTRLELLVHFSIDAFQKQTGQVFFVCFF